MSRVSEKHLREAIQQMLEDKISRDDEARTKGKEKGSFVETIELQVRLTGYDVSRDRRFSGKVKLPSQVYPNRKFILIGTMAHCEKALAVGIPAIELDALTVFNRDKKLIKKWAKYYDDLLASRDVVKRIPRILGASIGKISKFPLAVDESENLIQKIEELRSTISFTLRKDLCLGTAVGTLNLTEEQLRQNINMSINFLVSLLKKGWTNIASLHIKSTQGKSYRLF